MVIGVCKLTLHLAENHSLKGKRQVVRSLLERTKSRFNVAVAEVDSQDRWQIAEIGISCVSGDARHAQEMLSKVVSFIEGLRLDAEVVDCQTEILHAC